MPDFVGHIKKALGRVPFGVTGSVSGDVSFTPIFRSTGFLSDSMIDNAGDRQQDALVSLLLHVQLLSQRGDVHHNALRDGLADRDVQRLDRDRIKDRLLHA